MKGILIGALLYTVAQTIAWFQTNSMLLWDWLANNVVLAAILLGPIVGLTFAYGTKYIYEETEALWVARFLGFAIGYIVFIPLTWSFFGESPFTLKNMISFLLCCILITIQFVMK